MRNEAPLPSRREVMSASSSLTPLLQQRLDLLRTEWPTSSAGSSFRATAAGDFRQGAAGDGARVGDRGQSQAARPGLPASPEAPRSSSWWGLTMLLTKGRRPTGGLPFVNSALPKSEAVFPRPSYRADVAQRRNPKRFQWLRNQTNSIPISATTVTCALPSTPHTSGFEQWRGPRVRAAGLITGFVAAGFGVGFAIDLPLIGTLVGTLVGAGLGAVGVARSAGEISAPHT